MTKKKEEKSLQSPTTYFQPTGTKARTACLPAEMRPGTKCIDLGYIQ